MRPAHCGLPPLRWGPDLADTGGMALLERELPLRSLADYADEARRGDGRVVLVSGEAGVGKSALLEEFAAGLSDALWCWGACDGLFTPRPLGALLDLSGQLGGDLARLCRVQGPRDDLFTALLGELSAQRGLCVVVVEDIHWADEATLDLLRFLARRSSQPRRWTTTSPPSWPSSASPPAGQPPRPRRAPASARHRETLLPLTAPASLPAQTTTPRR